MDRLVFLHVPKTGGSSLTGALSKKFANWEIFPWHHTGLDLFNPVDLMPFRFFTGHFDIIDLDYIPPPAKSITLIREPRKRIQSLYNYWRSIKKDALPKYEPRQPQIAKSVGFRSFLTLPNRSIRVAVDNAMVRAYVPYPLRGRNGALAADAQTIIDDALATLDKMTAFGVLERFDESVKVIGAELGIRLILPTEKVRGFETLGTNLLHEMFDREETTPEIEDLLNSNTELDRLFYDRALKLFDAKFGRHLPAQASGQDAASAGGLANERIAHEWGDWINFGADFHLDGVSMTGWSTPEDWGVWSVVEQPALRIGPLRRPAGSIRLTLAVRAAVFAMYPEQTVTIAVNGQPIESWDFIFDGEDEKSVKTVNLPGSAVDDEGFLNLSFHVQRLVSPLTAGISADSRELGLGLETIHLECSA